MNPVDQNETDSKAVFSRIPAVTAPPYLAARVLALYQERRKHRSQLWIWRLAAAASLTAAIALVTVMHAPSQKETLFADQAYVIHVNLDDAEMQVAASAEVELPAGVTFVSKNEEVRALRQLRLPVAAVNATDGRSRLPFVVKSDRSGTMPLQVRIYDADDKLIQTKTLTLHFERAS